MREDMRDILLDRAEIARRVKELGRQITEDYRGETPLLVCILKGSVVFFADLIRAIDLPVQLEFMTASATAARRFRRARSRSRAIWTRRFSAVT